MQIFRLRKICFFLLIIIVLALPLRGQIFQNSDGPSKAKDIFASPLFLYNTFYFISAEDSTTYDLDVYFAFANDILQFVKGRQADFTGGYDLFVTIFDKKGNLIAEKSTQKKITVDSFEATNDRNLRNRLKLSFELIPGEYKLVLNLTDHDTQKNLHREKELHIKSFGFNKLAVSEILFADYIAQDSMGQIVQIFPNLDRNFTDPNSLFWAFFKLHPVNAKDSLKITYTVTDASDQAIVRDEHKILPTSKVFPYLFDLSKHIKSPGRYSIIAQIKQNETEVKTQAKFSANWSNFTFSKLNISSAIEALKEFIPDKEYKMTDQMSDSVKEDWFKQFWTRRDPTLKTEKNELQEEFYRRIDFANNQFTVNALDKEGWQTDRGNIYIKYGPPTDVERHIDEMNIPPYEIWYYHHIERRYIFEDKSGIGDFKLVRVE
jgi:GWxTD domain-containing protein